ncbi:MAG TPA: glycosyltransferase family 39 protein [Candidatus Paceibacterota bacterium]|nr:glycosyltransferase family 39 protein [Candidatus Paceibacterota bacterium]
MRVRLFPLLILIGILFVALRLPGLDLPYHQDEWKNVAAAADPASGAYWAHPPLFQVLFRAGSAITGPDAFRLLPLLFSLGCFALLYLVVKARAGTRAALFSLLFFALCFYNVLGSLMPDVDGAIIPFFFLLSVYYYDRYMHAPDPRKNRFLALLLLSLMLGFLVKLNFVLVIGTLLLDYLWNQRHSLTRKRLTMFVGGGIAFGGAYVALLYVIQAIYPSFTIAAMIGHADQFAPGQERQYLQIAVQSIKAVYYLSPLLILPLLLVSKRVAAQVTPFLIYLVSGLFFYLVLFDFSRGALDKYLMFLIVPLCVVVGTLFADVFAQREVQEGGVWKGIRGAVGLGGALSMALIALNFIPHEVAALYPKTEWFARIVHGQWNVLTPLTGGSGPLGFYVSFLFIAVSYGGAALILIAANIRPEWQRSALSMLFVIAIAYNGIFLEELMWGRINGNARAVVRDTVAYVAQDASIKKVLTYNDSGAGLLEGAGKYGGRFYATPSFEEGHKEKFAAFEGAYMVVDIPHLYENGFYAQFFANCTVLHETVSGRITGRVYDCRNAKALLTQ